MKNNILAAFLLLILAGCSSALLKPDPEDLSAPAPSEFKVLFETSKGNFTIDVKREYSPKAVDRFYYLVQNGYYDGNRFFRVVPNFVVQWGINGNSEINKVWDKNGIEDEPVKLSNHRGTIAFARGGPNTRSNQVYINFKDNLRLDTTSYNNVNGFPAFGKVIEGMATVDSIYSGYLQKPDQDSIQTKGNEYLLRNFPKLDYIIKAEVIE